MAQIIKHRRGTLPQLQGVTLANGEIGIVSSSASNIGDSVLRTGLVIGNTDGTNRLTFARLPQGNATPNLGGITGGSNFKDMLYHETDAKTLLVLHTSDNTNLDLTGNIANRTIDGTLAVNGNFEVTGSIIGTSTINAASFGSTLAGLISGSFSSISSSLASRITAEETVQDYTPTQISGSWQGAISDGSLTSFSGSLASTGSFGRVEATRISGVLTTADQTNITSIGALSNLTVGQGSITYIDIGGTVGSTIDDVTIGGNIAASGKFTTVEASGDIRTSGNVIAQNLIVSSSVSHFTQSFSSGSTIFGDNSTDTHKVTGSLQISGGLSVDNGTLGGILSTTSQPSVIQMTGLQTVTIQPVSGISITTSTGFGGAGNINGFVIGDTNAAAASFTSVTATGNVSSSLTSTGSFGRVQSTSFNSTTLGGTLTTAAQPNITSIGALSNLTVGQGSITYIDIGGTVGSTIDDVTIGGNIAASGKFTTVEASGNAILSGSVVLGVNNTKSITMNGVAAGTDNTVLVLDGSNIVKSDEIDSRVWGTPTGGYELVDGSGGSNQITYWSDDDTITSTNAMSFDGNNLSLDAGVIATGNISSSLASTGSFGHLIINTGTIDGGAF